MSSTLPTIENNPSKHKPGGNSQHNLVGLIGSDQKPLPASAILAPFNEQKVHLRYLKDVKRLRQGAFTFFPKDIVSLILEYISDEVSVSKLLQYVVEGEQDKAEELVSAYPELLLQKGTVKDLSQREFKAVTGFQYALWALDCHMWTMLLKYMEVRDAALQYTELEKKGTEHGKRVSWQGLIDAYKAYIPLAQAGNWTAAKIVWCEKLGEAQLLLPVHVVNEYCHVSRAFYPLPDFTLSAELTRKRESAGVDWYDARCGKEWGHYRGGHPRGRALHRSTLDYSNAQTDKRAVASLLTVRQRQLAELGKTLTSQLPMTLKKNNRIGSWYSIK